MNEIGSLELVLEDDLVQPGYVGYGPLGYGVYYLMAAPPYPPITVEPGDTVTVSIRYQHRGSACNAVLYCAMGTRFLSIFDEDSKLIRSKTVSLPREDTWTTHDETIGILIPSTYTNYGWKDIYAKIMLDGKNMAISPEYDNCIQIAEVVPEFQLVEISKYETV